MDVRFALVALMPLSSLAMSSSEHHAWEDEPQRKLERTVDFHRSLSAPPSCRSLCSEDFSTGNGTHVNADAACPDFTLSCSGTQIVYADFELSSNGRAPACLLDSPSTSSLTFTFDSTIHYLKMRFGNDDPGFSSPGLTAVLTTENGVESIVVANQNDIMDQDIEVHDPDGFTTATFIYTDNLTEIIDDVEYCVGDGAGANGDPHIVRWKQTKRDSFHGECDLVLMTSDSFNDGTGLDVHIRTTIQDWFSYIEQAAIGVGDHIVEFRNKVIYLDGVELHDSDLPLKFGPKLDYSLVVVDPITSQGKHLYRVYLSDTAYVTVKNRSKYMAVTVVGGPEDFPDARGMMGAYDTGATFGRAGQVIGDFNDFGFEWQVHGEERKLFLVDDRDPQLPYERCRMPSSYSASVVRRRRRLRADAAFHDEAIRACRAHVTPADVELCAEDVVATRDLDMAAAW